MTSQELELGSSASTHTGEATQIHQLGVENIFQMQQVNFIEVPRRAEYSSVRRSILFKSSDDVSSDGQITGPASSPSK
ncbi:hypothetical protein F2P81_004322 [Scophthalmus maximus]|uniref:Uncharacterized protein n=1 Tax=Scophthalmus maximus TaxID=52904 RepID=A0A6A4TCP2_SCOMX|nr:hypothetical protein F2P81_004322 [Scophthalmus maximus]